MKRLLQARTACVKLGRVTGPGPRMSLVVDLHQFVDRYVSVNLCGRQASVPQQFLNRAQIGSSGQQVSRNGVAQRMRTDVVSKSALKNILVDQPANRTSRDPGSLIIEQQRFRVALVLGRFREQRASNFHVRGKRVLCLRSKWDEALLASFSSNANHFVLEVDVFEVHSGDLRYPAAGGVQQFQYRAISRPKRRVRVRRFDEVNNLVN